jgi:predicted nucleic acid-binding Zn ribbon protein
MSGFTYTFICRRCGKSFTVTAMAGSPESTICNECWHEEFNEKHPELRQKPKEI